MSDISLLIIEDEQRQIQVYQDTIETHNKKNDLKFTPTICTNYKDGEEALKSPLYDAAIIDLKLSATDELEGKKLLEAVYQKLRIPIIVYSGSISQIDDIVENALLKKRLRTDQLTGIFQEIIGIYNTGLTRLLRSGGEIDKKLTTIFWDNLSRDLETWIQHNNPDTLLRYIFSHFLEHLEIDAKGDFEEYHPSEIYIKPPIKKNMHTGDLIRYNKENYIVLSPACDMAIQDEKGTKKADFIILVEATNFDYKTLCTRKGKLERGVIENYVKNKNYRYHYLPSFEKNDGFLIDFQKIISLPNSDNKLDRLATISSPFLKDIIARFSSYYSRQGQPTFNQDLIVDELFHRK